MSDDVFPDRDMDHRDRVRVDQSGPARGRAEGRRATA